MALTDEYSKDIRLYVLNWNIENPIDKAWREYFGIAFGSKEHLETNFIDQVFWFEEKEFSKQLQDDKVEKTERVMRAVDYLDPDGVLTGRTSNQHVSKEATDKMFEDFDIDAYN